jgi:parallel beta-helix repeat protein
MIEFLYMNWKYLSCLLFLLLLLEYSYSETISITKINSPYYIEDSLVIKMEDELLITEGAVVYLYPNACIKVYGQIVISGTAEEPVAILAVEKNTGWGDIIINNAKATCSISHAVIKNGCFNSTNSSVEFNHVKFINHQFLPWNKNILSVFKGRAKLLNCTIEGPGRGEGCLFVEMGKLLIKECSFVNTPDAVECSYVYNSTICNNSFINIGDDAIDLNGCRKIVLENNIIVRAVDRGIEVGSEGIGSSHNITVSKNIIVSSGQGIVFKEGSDGKVIGNILFADTLGLGCLELVPGRGASWLKVENTIIFGSVLQDFIVDSISYLEISRTYSDIEAFNGEPDFLSNPKANSNGNPELMLKAEDYSDYDNHLERPVNSEMCVDDLSIFIFNTDQDSGERGLEIFEAYGRKVLHIDYPLKNSNLDGIVNNSDIKALAPGYYILKVNFDSDTFRFPLFNF